METKKTENLQFSTTPDQPKEPPVIKNFAEFLRRNKIKIMAVLAMAGLSEKAQAQITGAPGQRTMIVDIYNATNGGHHNDFAKQLETTAEIYRQDRRLQDITPVGVIADDNFNVNQSINPPYNNTPILKSTLDATTTAFQSYLRQNIHSDSTHFAWLQLNQNFAGYYGIAPAPAYGYDAIGTTLAGITNRYILAAHELAHNQGLPPGHMTGVIAPVQATINTPPYNNNTPFNPTDDYYVNSSPDKSFGSAGVIQGSNATYKAFGSISPQYSTAIEDPATGIKWVYFKTASGQQVWRVKLSDIQSTNSPNNTLDTIAYYFANKRPDRLHDDTSNLNFGFPSVAPSVYVNTNDSLFVLNFAGNDTLTGTHAILKSANGTVLASAPDYYLLYVYDISDTTAGGNLNLNGLPYFAHHDTLRYNTYGTNPANLWLRIANITKNKLGPAFQMLVPPPPDTTAPVAVLKAHPQVFLDASGQAGLSFTVIDSASYDNSGSFSVASFSPTQAGCIDLGQLPVSYTLSDSAGNTVSGTDTVEVSDTLSPQKPANFSIVTNSAGSLDLSWSPAVDNCGVAEYEVFKNGLFLQSTTGTSLTGLMASPGDIFRVRAKDGSGNVSPFSTEQTVGIDPAEQNFAGFSVYPNPVGNTLHIKGFGRLDDIEIYDAQGRLVKETDPQGATETTVNTQMLLPGVYLFHIWNKSGQLRVVKVGKM